MVTPDHEVAFNLASRIDIDDIESIVAGAVEEYVVQSMVGFIKKPDYLSNSMWELRHGTKSIGAKIEDVEWLDAFQMRRVDLRPGDAIKYQMRVELIYGYDNELVREKYYVERVHEILANHQYEQTNIYLPGPREPHQ